MLFPAEPVFMLFFLWRVDLRMRAASEKGYKARSILDFHPAMEYILKK